MRKAKDSPHKKVSLQLDKWFICCAEIDFVESSALTSNNVDTAFF